MRFLAVVLTLLAGASACIRSDRSRVFELKGADCKVVWKGMRVVSDGTRMLGEVRSVSNALFGDTCTVSLDLDTAPEWKELTENNCSVLVEEKAVMLRLTALGFAEPAQLQQGKQGCRVVSYRVGSPNYPR